jgi:hypothetical protein
MSCEVNIQYPKKENLTYLEDIRPGNACIFKNYIYVRGISVLEGERVECVCLNTLQTVVLESRLIVKPITIKVNIEVLDQQQEI